MITLVIHILSLIVGHFYLQPYLQTEQTTVIWSDYHDVASAQQAYGELKDTVRDLTVSQQHEVVHQFARGLYQKLGLTGFIVCDDTMLYGCVHQFMGDAVLTEGTQIINELNHICQQQGRKAPYCLHGIGHGILGSLGYTFDDLSEALRLCTTYTTTWELGGCAGGVFMEYNLRSMVDSKNAVRKNNDLADPCNKIDDSHKPTCAYWLPQWWGFSVLKDQEDLIEVARKISDYCKEHTANQEMLEACALGSGLYFVTAAEYDTQRTISMCEQAYASEIALLNNCISRSALRMKDAKKDEDAKFICGLLSETEQVKCSF